MLDPRSDLPIDSSRNLLDGWDLGDSGDSDPGDGDSVLCLPGGSTSGYGPAATGKSAPWPQSAHEESSDARLFQAFTLGGDDPSIDDADLGLGESLGPIPEDTPATVHKPEPASRAPVVFPKTGQSVGGFALVAELGRGAFARVYLAEQESLGRRLVALKVSRAEGEEPQILARLQHTHIVPIYSLHDDPESGLRLMCMPYLGGANLAQVLEAAGAHLPRQTTGRSFVDALDAVSNRFQAETKVVFPSAAAGQSRRLKQSATSASKLAPGAPVPTEEAAPADRQWPIWTYLPGLGKPRADAEPEIDDAEVDQPARQFLREANPTQAAVWIVARLAEGLEHAHSRGLLHRDLKPSNVLIADDGTPMLLDFNLSADTSDDGPAQGTKAMLGGTLPYMAPEHLDAFNPTGSTSASAVDERSDLYALGLILFETIAGEHPFPEPPPNLPLMDVIRFMHERRKQVPSLRAVCPDVPWGLDALVAKCLDPNPDRRFARARDLAEDLRRFLDDLPLKHAPEPSLRERLGKWTRRNPRLCSTTSIALLSTCLLIALGGVMTLLSENLRNVAARLKLQSFQSRYDDCQFLLNTVSGPSNHLGGGIALADETLERLGFDEQGNWRGGSWVSRLTPDEQTLLHDRITELIILEARARVATAGQESSEGERRQALEWAVRWLGRAERLDPRPPAALYGDRARYLSALGFADEAARERAQEAKTPLSSSRDFALRGTSLLAHGDATRAEDALQRAISLDGRSFWAWFVLGHCHFRQGRYLEAAGDFAACTVLEPQFAWPHMNRGLALASAGRYSEALECYDRALEENPRFAEAMVNRALVLLELNDPARAETDLRKAITLGRRDVGILAALGQVLARAGQRDEAERIYTQLLADEPDNTMVLAARGIFRLANDPQGARADLARVLQLQPSNARAHYGIARLLARDDPHSALEQTTAALDSDPQLLEALELRAVLRGRQGDPAAIDDVERLLRSPTAYRLYNASCALALLSQQRPETKLTNRACSLLGQAITAGFPAGQAANDPDWKPYRNQPEFQQALRRGGNTKTEVPSRKSGPSSEGRSGAPQ